MGKRRAFIATGGVLIVQEGLEQSQMVDIRPIGGITDTALEPRTRTTSKCSMCKSLEHTARTCPNRQASN